MQSIRYLTGLVCVGLKQKQKNELVYRTSSTSGARNKTNIGRNISSYERINENLMRLWFERSFFLLSSNTIILVASKQTEETDLYHSDKDLS